MVTVMKGREEVKISKRAGSYVTVRDLSTRSSRCSALYFCPHAEALAAVVRRGLARSQATRTRVLHPMARALGTFRVGEIDPHCPTDVDFGAALAAGGDGADERFLDFPRSSPAPAESPGAHRVATVSARYGGQGAPVVHKAHVLNEPEPVTRARLLLARAAQIVLRNGPPCSASAHRSACSGDSGPLQARFTIHVHRSPFTVLSCPFSSSARRAGPVERHSKGRSGDGGSRHVLLSIASHLSPVQLVGVVGDDYPMAQLEPLKKRGVDMAGGAGHG